MEASAKDAPQVKPFAQFVQEQRDGAAHGELSEMLQDLVAAVVEHNKAGKLTLTITVQPGEAYGTYLVRDDVKSSPPKPDKTASLFYADDRGNLSRRNPMQPELPLRPVAGGANDNDDAEGATG